MKLPALFLAGILTTTASLQAQKTAKTKADSKLYVRFGAGYGFTHAGQTMFLAGYLNGTSSYSSGVAGSTETYSLKRGSFGTGGALTLAGGYMLSKHVGIELGLNAIVLPKKYDFSSTSSGNITSISKLTTAAKLPVYVIPALLLTTGVRGLSLYSRTGIALPIADKIIIKHDITDYTGQTNETYELTQRFSVGFQSALGISYPVAKNITIWGEVGGMFRNAYAKKLELTVATQNGIDVLPSFSTNDKVVEFDYDLTTSSGGSSTEPQKGLTSASPLAASASTLA